MMTKRYTYSIALILCGYSISLIAVWASLGLSNAGASEIISNNSNIKVYPSTSSFNESSNVRHSPTNMTMMEMIERGDIAMGFNQNKITHHFVATPDGGKIIITSLNSTDRQTINQIKNHILDIQKEFSEGNFTKPFFIHAQEVPGAEIMSKKKDLIKYSIQETNNGSSLLLSTNDKELVDAIKHFMQFQTRQHYGH
jgi:DNA replication protein DnaD